MESNTKTLEREGRGRDGTGWEWGGKKMTDKSLPGEPLLSLVTGSAG